jgi:hypothetical protein
VPGRNRCTGTGCLFTRLALKHSRLCLRAVQQVTRAGAPEPAAASHSGQRRLWAGKRLRRIAFPAGQ